MHSGPQRGNMYRAILPVDPATASPLVEHAVVVHTMPGRRRTGNDGCVRRIGHGRQHAVHSVCIYAVAQQGTKMWCVPGRIKVEIWPEPIYRNDDHMLHLLCV